MNKLQWNAYVSLQLMSLRGTKRSSTDTLEQPSRTTQPPPLISDKGYYFILCSLLSHSKYNIRRHWLSSLYWIMRASNAPGSDMYVCIFPSRKTTTHNHTHNCTRDGASEQIPATETAGAWRKVENIKMRYFNLRNTHSQIKILLQTYLKLVKALSFVIHLSS